MGDQGRRGPWFWFLVVFWLLFLAGWLWFFITFGVGQ